MKNAIVLLPLAELLFRLFELANRSCQLFTGRFMLQYILLCFWFDPIVHEMVSRRIFHIAGAQGLQSAVRGFVVKQCFPFHVTP